MDLESQPKPLTKLISYFSLENSKTTRTRDIYILFDETARLEPTLELVSVIQQILNLVISMNSEWKKLIPLCPQVEVYTQDEMFQVRRLMSNTLGCFPANWKKFRVKGEESETHFFCQGCCGENHMEDKKAPVEIKHPLHPKHSLQLVFFNDNLLKMKCYCCSEALQSIVYHCSACSLSLNFSCSKKLPEISIERLKWHQHTLTLFPSQDSVCTVCALRHSRCPFYICPPCDFLVHQSCLSLLRVIRICRHHHRISFSPSFGRGNWVCRICREKIDNNYGGYSCIKDDCSYAAHSKCATQKKLWDGKELEGVPEEIEEEVAPFVKLSNGDIQHFSHPCHHLRLSEDKGMDYDENKHCRACITPVYYGNFYSCIQCDFILHEACAKLSCKIYHPIHPHRLTLVPGYDCVMEIWKCQCSACPWMCVDGFFYKCEKCLL